MIYLHDFKKPLASRVASRKYVGPYQWTPSNRALTNGRNLPFAGRGFYLSRGHAEAGGFDLRIEQLDYSVGYDDCDAVRAIIVALPHGKGWLAGWTMGNGMASGIDGTLWDNPDDAKLSAHDECDRIALADYEAQEAFNAEAD